MTSDVTAIVAAHGGLAAGLVGAVQLITGRGAALRAFSNEGLGGPGVVAALGRALDETGATVVFTDLPAGSCTMAARRLQAERAGLTVVAGVNLPTLLEFVLTEHAGPAAARASVQRGREHLHVIDRPDVG